MSPEDDIIDIDADLVFGINRILLLSFCTSKVDASPIMLFIFWFSRDKKLYLFDILKTLSSLVVFANEDHDKDNGKSKSNDIAYIFIYKKSCNDT